MSNQDIVIYTTDSDKFIAFTNKHNDICPVFGEDSNTEIDEQMSYALPD
jgi:hypothetical protein